MKDKLNPDNFPVGGRVKRLNKIPLFIILFLAILTLGVIAFLIIQSGKERYQAAQEAPVFQVMNEQAVARLLHGKQRYGVIAMEDIVDPQPVAALAQHHPLAGQPVATRFEKKSEQQRKIESIEQMRFQTHKQAVMSPISVKGGGMLQPVAATVPGVVPPDGKAIDINRLLAMQGRGQGDPNKQQHKLDFFMEKQPITQYLPHTRNKPRSHLELKTGTIIPAIMISGINSDLPGMILAQVSQNVYDTATGNYLLIPQGSRLVGGYDSFITYGQNRLLVMWTRIVYPDGSTLELGGMPGADQGGYAGFADKVNRHYFRIFGSAILMAVIGGLFEHTQAGIGSRVGDETVQESMADAVAREITKASTAILQKNLNIQPTIIIRSGYRFLVMVRQDIIFPEVWEVEHRNRLSRSN